MWMFMKVWCVAISVKFVLVALWTAEVTVCAFINRCIYVQRWETSSVGLVKN